MENCPFSNTPCTNSKCISFNSKENGENVLKYACENCADKVFQKTYEQSFNLLMSLIEETYGKNNFIKKCVCGACYEDLLKVSRFGCESCYNTFKEYVMIMFDKCQVGKKHIGKKPKTYHGLNLLHEDESVLENQLKEAVKAERYEEAAELKERITSIKKKKAQNEI